MKKTMMLAVLGLLMVSMMGVASAKTLIAGKIYDYNYQNTIPEAYVTVTCNGNVAPTIQSESDGSYAVTYNETGSSSCNDGDNLAVYAEKGSLSGIESGVINEDVFEGGSITWNLAIVNVPIVPEFGLIIGLVTVLSAVGIFFFVRRE